MPCRTLYCTGTKNHNIASSCSHSEYCYETTTSNFPRDSKGMHSISSLTTEVMDSFPKFPPACIPSSGHWFRDAKKKEKVLNRLPKKLASRQGISVVQLTAGNTASSASRPSSSAPSPLNRLSFWRSMLEKTPSPEWRFINLLHILP